MKYFTTVIANEDIIEVRIAIRPNPGAGYIAACRPKYGQNYELMPPAIVWINVQFNGDKSPDEIDEIQRWFAEAASMARQLDEEVGVPADFDTAIVTYKVRQVAGTLILDKIEPVYQQKPVEEWQGRREE